MKLHQLKWMLGGNAFPTENDSQLGIWLFT